MVPGHKPSSKLISSPALVCISHPRLSLPFPPWSPFPSMNLPAASFLPTSKGSKNKGSSAHGSEHHRARRKCISGEKNILLGNKLTNRNKVQSQQNKNENKLFLRNSKTQKDLGGSRHRANCKAGSSSSWPHTAPLISVPIDLRHGPQHHFRLGTRGWATEKGWCRGQCAQAEHEPAVRAAYK